MTNQNERHSAPDSRKQPVFYRSLAKFLALSLFSNLVLLAASPQVLGREVSQQEGSAQEATKRRDGAVDEKDVRPLEEGHPVQRELRGGQRHSYRLRLGADQFLKAIIEQQGIDVVVQIIGLDGNQILEFDSERRPQGQEQVSLVAEAAGDYRLVVRSKRKETAAGSYEIRIEELRAATANDSALHEANKRLNEANRLRLAGKYNEALPLTQDALGIREKILGPDHRDVAAALNGLAVLYAFKGEYVQAESLYHRTLLIREKVLGPDHPEVAQSLNHLASLYVIKSDYAKAESFYERALLIVEKALGPDHPDVASLLNNLGGLYRDKGDYAKAELLLQRGLLIKERTLGPDHPDVTSSLNNLANLYRKKGDYTKAEPLLQRAVSIMEKVRGPDHPDVAAYLNNLANLYCNRGDYEKAEPLFQRALLIKEKALGPDHSDVADILNNIALIRKERGDYVNAVSLYKRSLNIKEKVLGPDHPDVAAYLNNIANLYRVKGNYADAEPFFERAVLIMQKVLGPDHPDVARSLNNLANLYYDKEDYGKAEPLYQRALLIKERALGPQHPDLARSLANLAMLCAAKGDLTQAVKLQSRANDIGEHNLSINLTLGSERQKLAYLTLFFTLQADFTLSIHSQAAPNDPQALDLAFTTLLRWKARGLDAMTDTIAALRRRASPQDQDLFDQLAKARSQLAALIFKESDSTKPETYRTRIKPLEEKVENLEAELSARSAEFRAQSQPVTLSAVQSALPSGSALIEFVAYTPRGPQAGKSQPPRYLAYLLATKGRPKWVDLGEAAPIERAVNAWRQSLRENSVDVKQLGRAVDELVMRPVRSALQSESDQIRRLLIAPDGSLNLIPFAALVDEENRYLIERYTISFLTSGRDLLRLHNPQPSKSAPLVLANPLFGRMASADTRGTRNPVNSLSGNGAGDQGETRSDPARIFFPPLPGTKGEALAIKAMLPEASLLLEQQATEAALKRASAPRILHIATHGFFIDYQGPGRIGSPGPTGPALAQANPYTVQLEAAPELKTAQETIQRLRTRGVDAYILKSKVKGKGAFFRVRTGNFPTHGEAQKYGADLQEKGVTDQFFVARYQPPQGDLIEPGPTIAQVETKPVITPFANPQSLTETFPELRPGGWIAQIENPLLRSGLALSGANRGKSGDDDGLLTALEVAGLDLWGTKLVVLSACDTGLGEVKNGEGVQGLRRALVLAGSETQVISLWAVPDELAKDIIIPYYKALRRGEGRGEGLRQVQLQMLRSRDRHHPFYWASFIQSGEWVNLDGRR